MSRFQRLIPREEFAEILASRSFKRAIEALRPYVKKATGPAPTIGVRSLPADELREYNRKRQAAARARRKAAKEQEQPKAKAKRRGGGE